MFHKIKGKNIVLDDGRTSATWNPVHSGGLAFTENPLNANDPVRLSLSGTGAVELGVTWQDPGSLGSRVPESASRLDKYSFLNDVKIHKRSCTMCITLDDRTQEVISSYGGGQYRQNIDCENTYWLVVDVKYGSIDLQLINSGSQNQSHLFSAVCGSNIKRLNDHSSVQTQRHSPASLCFSAEPVTQGEQYVITCSPKSYQGTIPGRFYLLLRYTKQTPEQFSEKYKDMFNPRVRVDSLSSPGRQEWTEIEKFEKEDCIGNPVEVEYTGNSFVYKSSSGKRSSQNCRGDNDSKIWLVFELYGISAKLSVQDKNTRRVGSASCRQCNREIPSIPEESRELCLRQNDSMLEVNSEQDLASPGISSEASSSTARAQEIRSDQYIDDPVSVEKAIQKNFTKLRDDFMVRDFLDHMFESDMLTKHEFEHLQTTLDSNKIPVTRKVLMILSSRPVSKKFMLMALEKTKQQFLIPYFFPEEEKE